MKWTEEQTDELIRLLREIKILLEKINQNENLKLTPSKKQAFGNYRKEVDPVRGYRP